MGVLRELNPKLAEADARLTAHAVFGSVEFDTAQLEDWRQFAHQADGSGAVTRGDAGDDGRCIDGQ